MKLILNGRTCIGILISIIFKLTELVNLHKNQRMIYSLNNEINEEKYNEEKFENRLNELLNEATELKNHYQEAAQKYGKFDIGIITDNKNIGSIFQENIQNNTK